LRGDGLKLREARVIRIASAGMALCGGGATTCRWCVCYVESFEEFLYIASNFMSMEDIREEELGIALVGGKRKVG
jgi:hypothetical protein